MGDTRNPRRGALPLPAPPPEDERRGRRERTNQGYRIPGSDLTGELPRLPEVELHETSEVRVDQRALAPGRGSLSRAQAGNPFGPNSPTRQNRPAIPGVDKPRVQPPARREAAPVPQPKPC